jgi:O-antigen/teichoic acid export membrane protein
MIIKLKYYFKKYSFVKNVVTLMTGTTISQAIPIVISPILTRIYTPEDFGLYSVFLSVASVLAVISTARYESAIMLPSEDSDAASIMLLSIFIATIVSSISLFVIYFFNGAITKHIGNMIIGPWLYFIPLTIIMQGSYQSMRQWNNRKQKYKIMAIYSVIQSSTVAGTNIGIGYFIFNTNGLILGSIIGQIVTTAMYVKNIWKEIKLILDNVTIQRIKNNALRYKSFVQYGTPALVTSSIAQESLTLLVTYFLDSVILGYIYFINRLLAIPSSLIGRAMGEVFYQHISTVGKKEAYNQIIKFIFFLFLFSIVMYFCLFLFLENYFTIIFGKTWGGCVVYIKYLLLVSFFSFIFSPFSILFNYYEIQHLNLIWQLTWLVSNIVVFYFGSINELTPIKIVMIFSIKQSILYIIGLVTFLYIANRESRYAKN